MTKNITILVAFILLVCLIGYIAVFGLNIGEWRIPNVFDETNGVRKGMDLVGGTVITFEAQTDLTAGSEELSTGMDAAVTMMTSRLSTMGYFEATVAKIGDKRLRIEIPAIQDPEEAAQRLGPTAQLEFVDAEGNVLMTGSDVKSASAQYGAVDESGVSQHFVSLRFNDARKFTEITKQIASRAGDGSNMIGITMDGEVISVAYVDAKYASTGINSEDTIISGNFDAESAKELANYINIGQLPFSLKEVELRAVGPQLGDKALENSLLGAGIGILLVFIFMIANYRLPGVAASLALSFYVGIVAVLITLFRVNLSLAGIAGIILSIGMAVDANVIIFERIKEELNNGKTVRSAIAAGFHNAFSSIIDSNVTTLIAAGVLWYRGTGSVQGFAVTLFIGVVVSMFTAVFVTRMLLNVANDLKLSKLSFFGAKAAEDKGMSTSPKRFPICKNFRWSAIVCLVLAVAGVVALAAFPFGASLFNFDIDFAGGTTFHYAIKTEATRGVQDEITSIVEAETGIAVSSVQQTGDGSEVIIKTLEMDSVNREKVFVALSERFGLTDADRLAIDNVSAAVGRDMQKMAVSASMLAVLLILVYIAVRFDLRSGLAAVVALIIAIISMVSAYVIFQIPMNINFIASLLTILGYSINATIVVFDRVRENNRRRGKEDFATVVDNSVWQTMARSANTTITTLLMIIMLIVFGVQSIQIFALTLLIGVVVGALSSVFVAGPVWAWLLARFPKRA